MKIKIRYIVSFFAAFMVLMGLLIPKTSDAEDETEHENDILVVANKGVRVNEISVADARAFFLKQRTSWKGGTKVIVVNAPSDTELRRNFRKKILGMDDAHEESYWQDEGIRKGLSKPPEFGNTLKAVFKLKGAVSYVYRKDFKEGVAKVLLVIEK